MRRKKADPRLSCEIIPFPAGKLVGKARWLVNLRQKTSVAAMSIIWDQTVEELESVMVLAGLPLAERERQQDEFYALVKAEIVRRDYGVAPYGGSSSGDAA